MVDNSECLLLKDGHVSTTRGRNTMNDFDAWNHLTLD